MARWWAALCFAVGCVATAAAAHAGQAIVDVRDAETLEEAEPAAVVAPDRGVDLLLLQVVRERVAAGALSFGTAVPVIAVGGDPGPSLAARARLSVGELVQLVLLGRSQSAIATLAAAVGPGWDRARVRLRRAAARLGLHATTIADTWPGHALAVAGPASARKPPASAAPARHPQPPQTTIHDLARVAATVAADPEIRRRLTLDGAPIADGAIIVRATDPLIARTRPTTPAPPARAPGADAEPGVAIASDARDGLELLAVASGIDPEARAWHALERGFERYRRVELVRAGQPIGGELPVRGGVVAHLRAVAAQSFALTVPRNRSFAVRAWWQLPSAIAAPVEPSQPLGELVFERSGRIIDAVPLVAPVAVAPNGWLDTAQR